MEALPDAEEDTCVAAVAADVELLGAVVAGVLVVEAFVGADVVVAAEGAVASGSAAGAVAGGGDAAGADVAAVASPVSAASSRGRDLPAWGRQSSPKTFGPVWSFEFAPLWL